MSNSKDGEIISVMRQLGPQEFEEFIATIWEIQGWETKVTQQSGDRGIDVVAKQSFPFEISIHIQVKRYGPNTRVTGPEMQKYGSLTQRPEADIVAVVTTSTFTSQAVSLAEEFGIRLVNGSLLSELVNHVGATEVLTEFVEDSETASIRKLSQSISEPSGESAPDNEAVKPTSARASGDWLQLEIVGAERKQGYLTQVKERKRERDGLEPIDGLVLAVEVSNLSDEKWLFKSNNTNGTGGGLIAFDMEGFSYQAVSNLEYAGPFEKRSGNWMWGEVIVRPNSRGRVVTWFDISQDTEITEVEYEEEVGRGTDRRISNEGVEKVRMSFPQGVVDAVENLPTDVSADVGE
jgi:hypothetical protein